MRIRIGQTGGGEQRRQQSFCRGTISLCPFGLFAAAVDNPQTFSSRQLERKNAPRCPELTLFSIWSACQQSTCRINFVEGQNGNTRLRQRRLSAH